MDLVVTMVSGSHTFRVNPNDTVGSLKLLLQEKLGIPAAQQRLVFKNGSTTNLNDDSRTLASYNLKSGSQVSLLVTDPPKPCTYQVFLKNLKGTNTTYAVTQEETVESFKRRVQEREGVPSNQQRLIHEGKEMQGGKLSDYNVRELSTIFLTMRLRGG